MDHTDKKTLLKTAMKGIRPEIDQALSLGRTVDISRLVRMEVNNIMQDWINAHPWYQTKAQAEHEEMKKLSQSLMPDLFKLTEELELKCRKEAKARDISLVAARALVGNALAEAGYSDFWFYPQKRRVKIGVRFGKNCIVLPLKYTDFPGIVDSIVPAVKDAERLCTVFGKDFKIL